ncbi:MAG: hypothetical protein IT558_00865 [Alphaproteobacteria bacterium]|nr:hypothetical protein [Alphaproteobacteria bacterium]
MAICCSKKTFLLVTAILAIPLLSACGEKGLYSETKLSPNLPQVTQERYFEKIPAADMNDARAEAIAAHYESAGQGPLELTIAYDPEARVHTARSAGNEAARLSSVLRNKGVRDTRVSIMPVRDQGEMLQVMVSYVATSVHGPADCTMMEGINDRNLSNNPDYKLGCSVRSVMTGQLARPKDLAGRAQEDPTTDGRRGANIVEVHRAGVQNKPLEDTESSSGN